MQMLKNLCDMDLAKVKVSLEEFDARSLGDKMVKEIEPRPNEHGNRRQCRAARAIARKEEA